MLKRNTYTRIHVKIYSFFHLRNIPDFLKKSRQLKPDPEESIPISKPNLIRNNESQPETNRTQPAMKRKIASTGPTKSRIVSCLGIKSGFLTRCGTLT